MPSLKPSTSSSEAVHMWLPYWARAGNTIGLQPTETSETSAVLCFHALHGFAVDRA